MSTLDVTPQAVASERSAQTIANDFSIQVATANGVLQCFPHLGVTRDKDLRS